MPQPAEFAARLREHRYVCSEILKLVEKENNLLRSRQPGQAFTLRSTRKNLLADLSDSLDKVRELRIAWLKLPPGQKQGHPEIAELLRENQNLIMKILVLDRENEQTLLRQGFVPVRPASAVARPAPRPAVVRPQAAPAVERPNIVAQRPHFVASMYQRNAAL
jgi:hypothetical protein